MPQGTFESRTSHRLRRPAKVRNKQRNLRVRPPLRLKRRFKQQSRPPRAPSRTRRSKSGRRSACPAQEGAEFAQQSTRNIEAVTQCSAVWMRGFQEISGEWLGLAQHRFQRNLEGLQALASCRTAQEVVAAQTDLVRENIQEVVEKSRRIAEVSMTVADEAAQTLASKGSSQS